MSQKLRKVKKFKVKVKKLDGYTTLPYTALTLFYFLGSVKQSPAVVPRTVQQGHQGRAQLMQDQQKKRSSTTTTATYFVNDILFNF